MFVMRCCVYMWYLVHGVDRKYVQYVCCSGDCVYMSVFVHMCVCMCASQYGMVGV